MNCKFEKIAESIYQCSVCGFKVVNPNVKKNCKGKQNQPKKEPNIGRRLLNFSKAAVQHLVKGNPTVTDEELERRHKICKNCPSNLFKRDKQNPEWGVCTHDSCGCNIKDMKNFLNKIAWADQKCPMGHWEAVDKKEGKSVYNSSETTKQVENIQEKPVNTDSIKQKPGDN